MKKSLSLLLVGLFVSFSAQAGQGAPKPDCCFKKDAVAAKTAKQPSRIAMMKREAAALPKTMYFDFDDNTVKPEELVKVQANIAFMQKYPEVTVQLTGHADERGSSEYNLALGNRRANAVASLAKGVGISANRLDVMSLGEEKPAVVGHTEESYAKNRRVEVEYFIEQ